MKRRKPIELKATYTNTSVLCTQLLETQVEQVKRCVAHGQFIFLVSKIGEAEHSVCLNLFAAAWASSVALSDGGEHKASVTLGDHAAVVV